MRVKQARRSTATARPAGVGKMEGAGSELMCAFSHHQALPIISYPSCISQVPHPHRPPTISYQVNHQISQLLRSYNLHFQPLEFNIRFNLLYCSYVWRGVVSRC